jgi:hypothetical protein
MDHFDLIDHMSSSGSIDSSSFSLIKSEKSKFPRKDESSNQGNSWFNSSSINSKENSGLKSDNAANKERIPFNDKQFDDSIENSIIHGSRDASFTHSNLPVSLSRHSLNWNTLIGSAITRDENKPDRFDMENIRRLAIVEIEEAPEELEELKEDEEGI